MGRAGTLLRRCGTVVLAFGLVLSLVCMAPSVASADVRRADLIMDQSVQARDIPPTACPSVDADYAMVVDSEGTVYFRRNIQERTHIASITKIMTAIVALESASLELPVTVSATAVAAGESTAGFWEGDAMTLRTALYGLLIPSGNDAAIAIAEAVGADLVAETGAASAQEAFVARMNDKASELGMANTLFANPHGLDSDGFEGDMYSTAEDVAIMCRYAMSTYPLFREIVAQPEARLTIERFGQPTEVVLNSTDELIGIYNGACGIKTGFTDEAGACFAGVCHRDGVDLFAIVLHSPTELQRFVDTQTLWDWVYGNHIAYPLAHSEEEVTVTLDGSSQTVPVVAEAPASSWIDKTVKATFAIPDETVDVFVLNGNVSQEFVFDEVTGAIEPGQKMGTARFYQANELIATADVVAAEELAAPDLFEIVDIFFRRISAAFTGESTQASPVVINETPLIYNKQVLGYL